MVRDGHCRSGKLIGWNGRYFLMGSMRISVFLESMFRCGRRRREGSAAGLSLIRPGDRNEVAAPRLPRANLWWTGRRKDSPTYAIKLRCARKCPVFGEPSPSLLSATAEIGTSRPKTDADQSAGAISRRRSRPVKLCITWTLRGGFRPVKGRSEARMRSRQQQPS